MALDASPDTPDDDDAAPDVAPVADVPALPELLLPAGAKEVEPSPCDAAALVVVVAPLLAGACDDAVVPPVDDDVESPPSGEHAAEMASNKSVQATRFMRAPMQRSTLLSVLFQRVA